MSTLKLQAFSKSQKFKFNCTYVLSGSRLTLDYVLTGEINSLRIPEAKDTLARGADLWKHTCFELFLFSATTANYFELNFSPTREWDYFYFDAYRAQNVEDEMKPVIHELTWNGQGSDQLSLKASLELPWPDDFYLSPSAVIEANDGTQDFYSLKSGVDKPDFHQLKLVKDSAPLLRFPSNDIKR